MTAVFGPLDVDWIDAYSAASLDDNPIHKPGLEAVPVVHGVLLTALMERAVLYLLGATYIAEVTVQFLHPVQRGTVVSFEVKRSRAIALIEGPARQFRVVGKHDGGRAFLMADCIIYECDLPSETQSPASAAGSIGPDGHKL